MYIVYQNVCSTVYAYVCVWDCRPKWQDFSAYILTDMKFTEHFNVSVQLNYASELNP